MGCRGGVRAMEEEEVVLYICKKCAKEFYCSDDSANFCPYCGDTQIIRLFLVDAVVMAREQCSLSG